VLRTIFVLAIIAYGLVQSFRGPFHALLFYLWIAYFRPESWLWSDWISGWNLSLIVGIFVVASTLLSPRKMRFSVGSFLMLLFLLQSLVSTMLSPVFDYSFPYWQEFAKTTIISLLIATLVDDERSLRTVFVVIAFSLGLEAVKQGWAQMLLNPGAPNTNDVIVLGDNNGVAVGMFMLGAMLVALARTARARREKLMYRFAIVGVVYRGLTTFSRGGFLACAALGLHSLLRSRQKFASMIGITAMCLVIVPVLSDTYWERVRTITAVTENPEEASVGRFHFWRIALEMTNDRPFTGVGQRAYSAMYNRYDTSVGEYGESRAVHSSWFSVLAELGYPGLFLFVLIVANAFVVCRRARRVADQHPELINLAHFAVAIEGALVTFIVGGTFVNFQYVEMTWHTLAFSAVIDRLVDDRLRLFAATPLPALELKAATPQIRTAIRPMRV